ncbi:hypothetical protein [Henriciella sp.]|uniref:hypothetical protein n=1 Tax=Henriciella sp. TaxID=1968823 RepID=UPI00261403D1|nr:hypothetical protein [Henriciella sp.]
MNQIRLMLVAAVCALAAPQGVTQEDVPESCKAAIAGESENMQRWKPCFEDAEPNSGPWFLAAVNLGSDAFYRNDHETAAYYYKLTSTERLNTVSDILLHTNRAATFNKTGDTKLASQDALIVWRLYKAGETRMPGTPLSDQLKFYVLMNVLEPLQKADPAAFEEAKTLFVVLPASDVYHRANKAAALSNVGETEAALAESYILIEEMPKNAQILNNHCYMLHETGRNEEAEPFCRRALGVEPEASHIKHSLASVLAGLGRCEEAESLRIEAEMASPSTALYSEPLVCTK